MIVFRILSAVLGLAFAVAIIWGFVAGGSVVPVLALMLAEPWGVVTLADLYLGFVLVAGLVVLLEPERRNGVLWGIAILLLGNVITAAWIALRLPHVLARFKAA
ncbi:MAG: DUF1475 family protein [Parvibaculum sp.]|uniref:hypothetical protein n=1 Tax=Parvibaculum sp. TaxID=2024848 RepID=UPI001DA6F90B|nr:hypothetical protein [Parvibaculum sp.]MBX3490265.1 DUF1475 family protein [Parvibaculum sp.]MBX3495248.1 DUF1475 family protein [Parvibaculum sp.]MCW5729053.1 DUF1475 family protein [Parvibaculum sp.]